MKPIKQRDLKKGMLVSDVDCTKTGDLFEVVGECTYKESLRLKLLTRNICYASVKDDNGFNNFGRELIYGNDNWYIPTQEEIELIKNRDK